MDAEGKERAVVCATIHSYKHKDLITREKERERIGVFKLLPRNLVQEGRKQASKINFFKIVL